MEFKKSIIFVRITKTFKLHAPLKNAYKRQQLKFSAKYKWTRKRADPVTSRCYAAVGGAGADSGQIK